MDPPRLDYAAAPPRNLRRGIFAFLVGYLIATLICWAALRITELDGPVLPLAVVIGPIGALMPLHVGLPEKAQLFLILVAAPALWGFYAWMLVWPFMRRGICLGIVALIHVTGVIVAIFGG
jgi:hypothetical protein